MNYEFMPHEMIRFTEHITEQTLLFNSNNVFKLHELLHNVAFRETLGNPLVALPEHVSSIKRATVNDFRAKYFLPGRMAFVGHGVNHSDLEKVLSTCVPVGKRCNEGEGPLNQPAKYYGGESHIFQPSSVPSDLLLAFPTPGYSAKDYAISKVASEMMGSSPKIKYFKTELAPYPLSTCTQNTSVFASSSLIQYSDQGLIVVHFHGIPHEVNSCSKKAFSMMCEYARNVSPSDLVRAKGAAILSLEKIFSSGHEFCLETSTSLFSAEGALSPKKCISLISQVTADDVKKVPSIFCPSHLIIAVLTTTKFFSTALKKNPTLVYSGNTSDMPHIGEFKYKD